MTRDIKADLGFFAMIVTLFMGGLTLVVVTAPKGQEAGATPLPGARCFDGVRWDWCDPAKKAAEDEVVQAAKEGGKMTWVHKTCLTHSCVADILNSLSVREASSAKLTTWNNTTYVWYRK